MLLSDFKEIFYNARNSEIRTWERLRPVRFALPVIIYKVNIIEHTNVSNIFTETVANLYKLGKSVGEIAEVTCIDKRIVESALEEIESRLDSNGDLLEQVNPEVRYIVYDCYNRRFFDSYIKAEEISEHLKSEEPEIDLGGKKLTFKKKFGESERRTAYILDAKRELFAPDEKELREYVEARKKNVYDRRTFYEYTNLYDTHFAFLVCTYFVPAEEPSQRVVTDPIYREELSNSLKAFLLNVTEKEGEHNKALKEALEELEEAVRLRSEALLEERASTPEYEKVVRAKFMELGSSTEKYSAVKPQLISLEKAFAPFTDPEYIGKDDRYKREKSRDLARAVYEVIEFSLAAAVHNNADGERCKSAKDYDHNSYKFLVERAGFEVGENNASSKFIGKARTDAVKGILSKPRDMKNLSSRATAAKFVACVLMTLGLEDSVMKRLALVYPDMPARIENASDERNDAKHDNEKFGTYIADEAKARYKWAVKTVHIIFGINAEVITEKIDITPVQANADVGSLVKGLVSKYNVSNSVIKNSVYGMVKAFYNKADGFWGECYNCLERIAYEAIYPYLTEEILDELIGEMPAEEEQIALLNGILERRGISDRIKTFSNREKAQSVEDLRKIGMSGLLYVFITLADRYSPELINTIKNDMSGFFDLAEFVKEKRGHNNIADFSGSIKEHEDTVTKILNYSIKITENEDEQE